jgi:hypothetical protein
MNLEDALLLHFEMKLELRMAMLEGRQLDCAQIADDCGCELGRWLQERVVSIAVSMRRSNNW